MDYCIPFIVDKRDTGIEVFDKDYCLLEAIRIISSKQKEDFFGLGNKENISSIGMVHIPLYLMEYGESQYSLFFYDDIMANHFSISLPWVSLDNISPLCEEIRILSAAYDFVNRVNEINDNFLKINKQHDTYYTMVRKDIADCLRFYSKLIKKTDETKFVLSDNKAKERNAEISRVYSSMETEQKNLGYIESNLEKLISIVNQKCGELLEKTSTQRRITYDKHSEKIDPLEKIFNEKINPPLLATLNNGISIIEKDLTDLYIKYEDGIISRLRMERDIQLDSFEQRMEGRRNDLQWETKKIESEYTNEFSNIDSERKSYQSKGYVDPGSAYDAQIISYEHLISFSRKMIERYKDDLDKLNKSENSTWKRQKEYEDKIRDCRNEIGKYEREIRNIENEKRNSLKQIKNEYNATLASYDTKRDNVQREYASRIEYLRSAMEDQIDDLENQRDSCKEEWDSKIQEQINIYSREKSKLIKSKKEIQGEYERIVAEEKSKFEPMKRQREQEDKIFENAILKLKGSNKKFNKMASEYIDNIIKEFNQMTHLFGMPLEFLGGENSGIIRLLIPIYVAEIKDKANNLRFSILPLLIYNNGKCSYEKPSLINFVKSTVDTFLTDSHASEEDQPILHHIVGKTLKGHINNDCDIRNAVLQYLRNNSLIIHDQKNILKLRVALEKMKKEGKIQEGEYKRILKVILSF